MKKFIKTGQSVVPPHLDRASEKDMQTPSIGVRKASLIWLSSPSVCLPETK